MRRFIGNCLLVAGALMAGGFGSPAVGWPQARAAEVVALQNLFNGRYLDAGRESVELKSEVMPDRCQWEKVRLAGVNRVALRNMQNRKYLGMLRRSVPGGYADQLSLVLRERIDDDVTKWEVRPRTVTVRKADVAGNEIEVVEELLGQFSLHNLGAKAELSIEPIFIELRAPTREEIDACGSWTEVVAPPAAPPAPTAR